MKPSPKVVIGRKLAFQRSIIKWEREHGRSFPWREHRSPYKVLITEVLLRRTTASAVSRIYEKFLELYPTIYDLAQANEERLEGLLSSIGYHKKRTKILKDIAVFVVEKYQGKIPRSTKDLLAIPHVGSYIAGAVRSFGYGISAPIVDSNVERIIKRVFFGSQQTDVSFRDILNIAKILLPKHDHQTYNYGLLDLGALICKYGSPRCSPCPLKPICDYCMLKSV
jgi:A/G-specific adenine glycosylase